MEPDFQLKISRKGYNIDTCSDRELVFSSEWPLLKLEATGTFSVTGAPATIFTHNLGYYPFYLLFINVPDGGGTDSNSRLAYVPESLNFQCDTTKLDYIGAETLAGRYYIYRLPLETNVAYSVIQPTDVAAGTVDNDYVFAISQDGKSVDSTDYRDFVIHSDCRSPMVHQVEKWVEAGFLGSHTITHGLGYEPMFFGFVRDLSGGGGGYSIYGNADDATITATTTQLTAASVFPGTYSIVIFKDSLLLK